MSFTLKYVCVLFICVISFVTEAQLFNNNRQVSTNVQLNTNNDRSRATYFKSTKYRQYDENRQPPPINKYALMARYIVNQADWAPVATISTKDLTKSYPFVNIASISDGARNNGSGIPYLFLTPLDSIAQDLFRDSRATLVMSLAQTEYCKAKNYDAMDPRCARVMLSGKIRPLKNNTSEHAFAREAMFERHPWLATMPADHHFFFAKLKFFSIMLLDTFGGPKHISVQDYLHPPVDNVNAEIWRWYQAPATQTEDRPNDLAEDQSKSLQNFVPSVLLT